MKTKKLRQAAAMRNPVAASLASGAAQPRIVRAKKGKGSYQRKAKHAKRAW